MALMIPCKLCERPIPKVSGAQCMDKVACEARVKARPAPQPAEPPSPAPSPEEAASQIAAEQRRLAVRGVAVTRKVIDKIEDAVENGSEVVLKDGSTVLAPVSPTALAALLRELRPIVQEPVRALEVSELSERPILQLDLSNPELVRAAIGALRDRRERRAHAASPMSSFPSSTQARLLPATGTDE